MLIRQAFRTVQGEKRAYWALVESYRCKRGPRQRVVAWLGTMDEAGRLGVQSAAQSNSKGETQEPTHTQRALFEYEGQPVAPQWVNVNVRGVRVENTRHFGGHWLALQLIQKLKLDEFLDRHLLAGKEQVRWSLTSLVLVIARLLEPSSELYIAEQWYR